MSQVTSSAPGDVGLRYHLQDNTTYCGAAVAQMILQSVNGELPLQDALAQQNVSNDPAGQVNGASVDALVWTLNQDAAVRFTSRDSLSNPLDAAVDAITQTGRGVAALVDGGYHWVALNGVVFDESASPLGLHVHDPHAYDSARVAPHTNDDMCGSGDTYGTANEYWTSEGMNYFQKAPVALVSTTGSARVERGADIRSAAGTELAYSVSHAHGECTNPLGPLAMADYGIRAAGIAERGPLRKTLLGFQPTRSVQVGDYWNVTLEVESRIVGYALLTGSGKLLMVSASGRERPLLDLSRESVLTELYRNTESIAEIHPAFMCALEERHATIKATFFWRLCREAPSPSRPLVRISVDTKLLYRDHFGTFHTRLHLLDR